MVKMYQVRLTVGDSGLCDVECYDFLLFVDFIVYLSFFVFCWRLGLDFSLFCLVMHITLYVSFLAVHWVDYNDNAVV